MKTLKILEVTFTNFSRIYSGLGKTYLHIDFSNTKNKIYLFVGENGTGKTSIMRALHPFAYNGGAGDNTANADFIIDGKDGKKEISYKYGNDRYDISHIYSRKKDGSLSVKSFIQKNGNELNDSGTGKIFKDLILKIFGLDEAFLGLLSLGNTIDGFVKYTAANRKKFATQIFSQLDIYHKYYKIVGAKVRDTKSILANVNTKLERYKIYDLEELELSKLTLEAELQKYRDELNRISVNIGGTLQIIKENESMIAEYEQKRSDFNFVLGEIDRIKPKIATKKDLVVLENDLTKIRNNINNLKIDVSGIEASISSELNLKDSKVSSMKSLQENLSRLKNSIDLAELTELKASLGRDLSEIEARNLPKRPQWSKEELIKINIYLDELYHMCIDLVNEVDDLSIIPEVLQEYLDNHDVDTDMRKGLDELTYSYNQERVLVMSKSLLEKIHARKIKYTCEKTGDCPYVKFYETAMGVITTHASDTDKKLQDKKDEIRHLEDRLKAATIIKRLYKFIQMNKDYFNLPSDLFDISSFVLQYLENRTIYDSNYLTYIIELEETYEKKIRLEESILDVTHKIESLHDTTDMYNNMLTEVNQLQVSIKDIDAIIEHQRKDLEYNTAEINRLEEIQQEVEKQLKLLQKLESLRNDFEIIKSELALMDSKMKNIESAQSQYNEYEAKKKSIERKIVELETQLQDVQITILSINELQQEQKHLIEKYSRDKLILEAVSPTTGIPLDFINYYIKEEMINKVNELLDTVYYGKLKLVKSKTIINESEFTIPYMKRSTLITDISKASDGEKAIISLAFSLVLLNITAGPYNILLLDEMDTTLDQASRAKYIELLEQFMKTIKAEQLFLISHNSMFDVYPVNLLLTSSVSMSSVDDSEIIDLTN